MKKSETETLVGTFRAVVNAGDENFSVVLQTEEPVVGIAGLERVIEGLVGERLREMVKRPSEAVFVNKIDAVPPGEEITDLLAVPILNPEWHPGARIVSIRQI